MTETCCRAITQAASMAKVWKERKEQKAECRNDTHEHSWIQNLTPPNPHKKQMTIHCFRVSACPLGRFTLPVIVLLNFLLSYILSVIFNFFFLLQHDKYAVSVLKKENYFFEDWLARNTCVFVTEPQRLSSKQGILWEKKKELKCALVFHINIEAVRPFSLLIFYHYDVTKSLLCLSNIIESNLSRHSGE